MAYQYQSFGSGQVFSAAEAQQIEDNIRDHRHGVDGVGPSGAAWAASSKASAFAVASTDAGTLFKCYGDYAVQFAAAATLGTAFGAAFKNVGSGRIQLNAASGQFIDNHSYYALCPGEGVSVTSDGTELTVIGGQDNVKLCRVVTTGSTASFELLKCFPGDFMWYELVVFPNMNGNGLLQMQVSSDSGSSYIAAGYANTTGAQTNVGNLSLNNTNSRSVSFSRVICGNSAHTNSVNNLFQALTLHGTINTDDNRFYTTSLRGPFNGIKILNSGGGFMDGAIAELYARGRVRR